MFPLPDCTRGPLDLVLVADSAYPPGCHGPDVLKIFFSQVVDMFSSPIDETTARLRVSLISIAPDGPKVILPFSFHNNTDGYIKHKIANLSTCAMVSSGLVKESNVRSTFDAICSLFTNDQDLSRVNATRVAVIVFGGPRSGAVDEIFSIQHGKKQHVIVKIFVIMVGFEEEAIRIASSKNSIRVPSYSDLQNNQIISMAICKRCHPGWFLFEHKNNLELLSCYFLYHQPIRNLDWFDASSACQNMGAQLASIETQEELHFLQHEIYHYLSKGVSLIYGYWDIFIGLRRDSESLPKRFWWHNHRPVTLSHWVNKHPDGGYLEGCGAWLYEMPFSRPGIAEEVTLLKLTFNEYQKKYEDGWEDIGCGAPRSNKALCEIALELQTDGQDDIFKVSPSNPESFINATNRGEFMEFRGQIVSVPANVENVEFYNKLVEMSADFKLFDCGEDEGDGRRIAYSYVCDHIQHCSNNRDEDICKYRRCNLTSEFECQSHQCVPLESRCDVYKDCYDGTDEEGCVECKQRRCCDGVCIPKHWFNDKEIDCSGCHDDDDFYVDENGLSDNNDEACAFICNRTTCVYPSQLNDGVIDCRGPEGPLDETIGKLERSYSCAFDYKQDMWSPLCVYIKDRYGAALGCRDMSHLLHCEEFVCPEGYVKCPDSYCIPLHYLHDGTIDCPLGEDEQPLLTPNCTGNFVCWNSDVCLHPDLVCDRHPHCPFGDDEQNCHVKCADGFRCIGGTVTVKNYNKSIPVPDLTFVDYRTRFLDLSGTDISEAFSRPDSVHLRNLVNLRLSNCKITNTNDSFANDISTLQSLYGIDLSHNQIAKVPKNSMFKYMPNMRVLNLSHNKELFAVEERAFLPYYTPSLLEYLDLSFTGITALESSALEGLIALRYLNLSHTMIVDLRKDTFPEEIKLVVLDLRSIALEFFSSDSLRGVSIQLSLYTDNFGLCCPQIRGVNIPEHTCHAPEDAISSCYNLVREEVQRILLWLVGVVAVLGNITVILCRFLLDRGILKKAYGLFVINLGISDLLMGVYLLIIAGADVHYRDTYVWNSRTWRSSAVCRLAGFLSTLSSETSAFFIFLVTLDRFLVIRFPFGQYSFSKRGIIIATSLAWILGFLLALMPLLPGVEDWVIYSSNGMCLGLPLTVTKPAGWEYSASIFVAINSVMFLVIACGQISIYRAMSGNQTAKSAVQTSNRRAQDILVAKQLSLVVLSDFLCWFPVGLMGLLALTGHNIGNDAYAWSAVLVLPVNSALNPVLYTVPVLQAKWDKFRGGKYEEGACKSLASQSMNLTTLSRAVSLKSERERIM